MKPTMSFLKNGFSTGSSSHRAAGKELSIDWKLILAVALIMGLKLAAVIAWIIRIC
ncbi:MAG: hypothetical protein J0H92_19060 [Sphingobacteriales bacterium]|nr:hypothetical protein [Sphingobacteriales bacterium]